MWILTREKLPLAESSFAEEASEVHLRGAVLKPVSRHRRSAALRASKSLQAEKLPAGIWVVPRNAFSRLSSLLGAEGVFTLNTFD